MIRNEGTVDRAIRAVLGIVFIVLATKTGGGLGAVFWVLAAVMLLTAAVGFCPLYRLFGNMTTLGRR